MSKDFTIQDELGNEIVVGSRCVYGIPDEKFPLAACLTTVTEITDEDADYDDELGRAVQYGPNVKFVFDTGEEEELSASFDWNESDHYSRVYTVADLELYRPVAVGITATAEVLARFSTVAEAEAWIAEREKTDPEGVVSGAYFIDAPEATK